MSEIKSVQLQYSESIGQDTYISNANSSNSYPNANNIRFGVDTNGFITRALLKPLFENIPANSYIEKAEIRLYCIGSGSSSTYDLHELYSFSEIATWNSHSNSSNYNTTPFLTLTNQTFTNGQWYSFSFLNLAREWFSGTKTNNGILFKSKSSTANGSMAIFASSNYVNSWQRPVIYYEYKTKGKKNTNSILLGKGGSILL